MARSIIFLTTPTSATGSMYRVLRAIATGRYQRVDWLETLYEAGRIQDATREVPPREDCLILHNTPQYFNHGMRLLDYRFVLNARDPRDIVCNQYHWQFVHEAPLETPEQTAARRERVAREGIDAFALSFDNTGYLKGWFNAVRRIAPQDRIFIGYAMYCLHFEEVVARASHFMGVPPESWTRQQRRQIARERVENLPNNPSWIGQKWAGTDTAPGRHRQELQPETIRILTERYRWFLDFLRRFDDPKVASTYE
jgi:hypothetical protein